MEWEWKYRIVKSDDGDNSQFSVEECLLDSDGIIQSHTIELSPKCETIDELKNEIEFGDTLTVKYNFKTF